MNNGKKHIAFVAILAAIMLLFGFTPIGYIPLPFAKLTLMCVPVIVGTLVLGLKMGLTLSVVFIITSIAQLLIAPDVVSLLLFESSPVVYIFNLIIPRLLLPLTTYGVYAALSKKSEKPALIAASAVGSLTNTFVYLGMLQIFFVPALAGGLTLDIAGATAMIWGVVLTNGLPEALIAAVVCPLVVVAVKKAVKIGPAVKKTVKEKA